MSEFLIGCCYYPEHWDEANMENDIKRIKALNFNVVRMGEFSWSLFEREEGKYDFSLLKKAVKLCRENGLDVILGTPTAAPPIWLSEKYPEILCVNSNGETMLHGSRQHHNHTSRVYLEYCAKITEKMVEAFKDDENVIGWQIDNEFNCHREEAYAPSDDAAFAVWLREKYKTIDALNCAWGTRFWSLEFSEFEQIKCPKQMVTYKNPSWMVDYYLFLSDSVINYAKVQSDIMKRITPDKFVMHNGLFNNLDYKKLTDTCLDFMGFDSYPAFYETNKKYSGRGFNYKLSLTRGLSEKFIIPEQQAGPGGQMSYLLATPLPGQIRLWTYQSIANGADKLLYFRYKTAVYGAEQLWYGIYDHDGKENYRSKEIRSIAEELNRIGNIFVNEREHNEVAILYDYHNVCNDKVETFAENDMWYIYQHLNKKNIHADFVYDLENLEKYKAVIIPHTAIAKEEWADRLKAFAEGGGAVIISARSGSKDENNQYRQMTAPGVFAGLCGTEAEWFTAMAKDEAQFAVMDGKETEAVTYYEVLNPVDSETVAVYKNGYFKGKSAITKKGNVYYIGFYVNDKSAELYIDLLKDYIKIDPVIDENLEVYHFDNHDIYLNYGDYEIDLSGYDKLTESEITKIPPYGVVLFER